MIKMPFIDKIIYINLDKRTDKREHMEKQLENVGFKERQGKQMASYSDNSKQFCDYNC